MKNEKKNIYNLLKTNVDFQNNMGQNPKLVFSRNKLTKICRSLSYDTNKYNPNHTIQLIQEYMKSNQHLPRILYSEVTNYVYSIDAEDRGGLATNVDRLLEYSLNNENIDKEVQETIIRIYDHCQLAICQADNVHNSFITGIEDTKNSLMNQFKGIEKEYISILGIFASIVLAFVGGLTFSTSVLENIDKASIYRQVTIAAIVGLVFYNLVWLLVDMIRQINDKDTHKNWILFLFDAILLALIIISVLAKKFRLF